MTDQNLDAKLEALARGVVECFRILESLGKLVDLNHEAILEIMHWHLEEDKDEESS